MDTRYTNSKEDVLKAKMDKTDWTSLSKADRIRSLELEGYVVIPDLIEPPLIKKICNELDKLETKGTDYSENQRGHNDVQWTESPHTIDLIANPPITTFLSELLGDELICTSAAYGLSRPGHPGIAIHTDAQPYGSEIFGVQASSPCLVRVLYYLDELTPLRSPLKVIPRSHLSLHADANPYNRYLAHEDEVMLTCKAGSAAIINQKVFHANYPNHSNEDRRMLAIAYRPAWAGPINDVPEYDPKKVEKLPSNVMPLFKSPNTRNINFDVPNRPDKMAEHAHGISPRRWSS
jgi:hypothetical protein